MLSSIFLFMSLQGICQDNFPISVQRMLTLSQVSLPIGAASLLQASKMLSAALRKHKHSSMLQVSQCVWYFSPIHAPRLSGIHLPRFYRQKTPLHAVLPGLTSIAYCVCKWTPSSGTNAVYTKRGNLVCSYHLHYIWLISLLNLIPNKRGHLRQIYFGQKRGL